MDFEAPKVGIGIFSMLIPWKHQNFNIHQKVCGAGLGTQCELALSSERAEQRVDDSHVPKIIIRHHSINMTVPGDDPEALEHHFAAKTVLVFFIFQTCSSQEAPNGFQ